MTKLYVVRHARAGSRSDWSRPDLDRPLDDRGHAQAAALAEALGGEPIRRVVASPARRCIDTVGPLAARLGLPVEIDDRLGEGNGAPAALAVAEDLRAVDAVVCSHGDVIPDLLDACERAGTELPERRKWQKASTWVLRRDGHGFASGRYLPPPA